MSFLCWEHQGALRRGETVAASRCFSSDMNCRRRKSAGPEGHGADAADVFLRRFFEARTAEASETESAWNSPVPQIRDGLCRLPV